MPCSYEYCFDTHEGVWKSWKSYVTSYEPPIDGQFSKILVSASSIPIAFQGSYYSRRLNGQPLKALVSFNGLMV